MKKTLAFLLVVLMVVTCLSASMASEPEKVYKIGYSMASQQDVFHKAMEYYLNMYAAKYEEEHNVIIEMSYTVADNDINKQQSDIMDLINAGNDVVMMCAIDSSAIVSGVKAVQDAKLPAMCLVRPADLSSGIKPDCFIGVDTVDQGYSAGVIVFDSMKANGKLDGAKALNILGDLRDENAINRSEGFKKACAEYDVEIVAEIECEWNPDKTLQRASAILAEKPEINVIFCPTDAVISGLQTAMERNDMWYPYGDEKHIYLASQDAYPIGYELVKELYVDSDTIYDPAQISEYAIDIALKLADGVALSEEESEIWLKGRVVTQANCDTLPDLWSRDYQE